MKKKIKSENRELAKSEVNCRNQNLQPHGQKIEMSKVDLENEI